MNKELKRLQYSININEILNALFSEKRIFCSEADFQFALARKIKELYPSAKIRLEYTPALFDTKRRIDIAVFINEQMIPIELKYKTKAFSNTIDGEYIYLRNHSAEDTGRYDFLRDIQRMEEIMDSRKYSIRTAYAVFLTNAPAYWQVPGKRKRIPNDWEFRIHEGIALHGKMNWQPKAGEGTKHGRNDAIEIRGSYHITWKDYVPVPECPFKYTVVEIAD